MSQCKICKGQLLLLGQLGMLKHFQCRDCGMMFSKHPKHPKHPKKVRDCFDNIISVKY